VFDTQATLALAGAVLLAAGVVVHRRGGEATGFALLCIGFAAAAGWGWLTAVAAGPASTVATGPEGVSSDVAVALAVSATALALAFLLAARRSVAR